LPDEFARQGISVSPQALKRVESQPDTASEIDVMAFAAIFGTDVTN